MGTSNIYKGPKDKKNKQENAENGNWKSMKSSLSKFLNSNIGNSKKLLSDYIKCLGGNMKAISQSEAGLIAGENLISFFNQINEKGLEKTLESYDIDYKGKDLKAVLSELVNKIATSADFKEDCVARDAISATMSELYLYMEKNNLSFENLNNIDATLMRKLLVIFFSKYIFAKFMADLGSRFDMSNAKYDYLKEKEKDIKELINSVVDISLDKLDLTHKITNINEWVKSILKECYEYLEVFE